VNPIIKQTHTSSFQTRVTLALMKLRFFSRSNACKIVVVIFLLYVLLLRLAIGGKNQTKRLQFRKNSTAVVTEYALAEYE